MWFKNMPVVRIPVGGPAVPQNVTPINRSEVIRRILREKGLKTPNNEVHNTLWAVGKLKVSDALINGQRRRLAKAI